MFTRVIILISCLILSNVANAAMLCCLSIEQSEASTTDVSTTAKASATEMPCHGVEDLNQQLDDDQEADQVAQSTHLQCDCDSCFQLSAIVVELLWFEFSDFVSSHSANSDALLRSSNFIYYPPKPIS